MKPSAQSVAAVRRLVPWVANTVISALLLRTGWQMAATAARTAPCPTYDNGALTCLFIGRASPQAEHGVVLMVLALGVWCAIGAAIVLAGARGTPVVRPRLRTAGLLVVGASCDLLLCALASFLTPIEWGDESTRGLLGLLENPRLLLEGSGLAGLVAILILLRGSSIGRPAH